MHHHKQTGSVIVTAIFVVALVVIISTSIALFARYLTKEAVSNREFLQEQYLLDTPIPVVENALDESASNNSDFGFNTKKGKITVRSYVTKPQYLLNLNAFAHLNAKDQAIAIKHLSLFIKTIGIKQNPIQVAGILVSSLNHKLSATGDNLSLYQWPGEPLALPSSLRGMPGITRDTYQALREWLTVLPTTALHVPNSSHWPVLLAFGLTTENAKKIATCLEKQPSVSTAIAMSNCKLSASITSSGSMGKITSQSGVSYFKVYSYYFSKKMMHEKTTLLYREKKGSKGNTTYKWHVVWQHNDANE